MPEKKQGKLLCVDDLRHAEYYHMQNTFDDLYARSLANETFHKLQVQVGHPAVEKMGSILATVLVEASDSTKIGASAAA